ELPDAATGSPSRTWAPSETPIDPRCVNVTARPSGVVIVTLLPEAGTGPANGTVPAAGATTGVPGATLMSMPRGWAAADGWAGSNENGWRTGPATGQVQAPAGAACSNAAATAASTTRRIGHPRFRHVPGPGPQRTGGERVFSNHGRGGSCRCQTRLR